MPILSPDDLAKRLAKGRIAKTALCEARSGSPPFVLRILGYPEAEVARKPLVVLFHGPKDRQRYPYPHFDGSHRIEGVDATLLSVLDPSLARFKTLRTAWYQGEAGHAVADELTQMIGAVVRRIRPSRLVFGGGGSGGHAALFQSRRFANSVAVTFNTHVRIGKTNTSHVREYRALCWPDLAPERRLSAVIADDLSDLYRTGFSNTVVYLQNSKDFKHLRGQMVPFLSSLPALDRVLVVCEPCGDLQGHRFPLAVWQDWVRAAVASSSPVVGDLVDSYARVVSTPGSHSLTPASSQNDAE